MRKDAKLTSEDKRDMAIVKDMVEKKVGLSAYYDLYSPERLTEILKKLKYCYYRVFMGSNDFEDTLVSTQEYVKQMGYTYNIQNGGQDLVLCVTADWHFGSKFDEPRFAEKTWDLCKERNIKYVLDLGDLAEGYEYIIDKAKKESEYKIEKTIESQVEYLQKYVPYDKDILHILEYGNHDCYSSNGVSLDIIRELNKVYPRSDIKVCGIEDCKLPINNDYLHLLHYSFPDVIRPYFSKLADAEETEIILAGHTHVSRGYSGHMYECECVPALSKVDHHLEGLEFFPGFIMLTISFDENLKMSNIFLQRYRFDSVYTKPSCIYSRDIEFVRRLTN